MVSVVPVSFFFSPSLPSSLCACFLPFFFAACCWPLTSSVPHRHNDLVDLRHRITAGHRHRPLVPQQTQALCSNQPQVTCSPPGSSALFPLRHKVLLAINTLFPTDTGLLWACCLLLASLFSSSLFSPFLCGAWQEAASVQPQ